MKDYTWLGGKITIERGCRADYESLERFHYLQARPAVWAGVWVARFEANDERRTKNDEMAIPRSSFILHRSSRVVAVAVLSHPTGRCKAREHALNLTIDNPYGPLQWLNANLRTISRVIVHPQFRAIGLAAELVRVMCEESGVRYVESIATMGKVVPFFESAGMEKIESEEKAYFLWERGKLET